MLLRSLVSLADLRKLSITIKGYFSNVTKKVDRKSYFIQVLIKNLSVDTTRMSLTNHIHRILGDLPGESLWTKIQLSGSIGRFAIVKFSSPDNASFAIKWLQDSKLDGKVLQVHKVKKNGKYENQKADIVDLTRFVVVDNLDSTVSWQDLKDHMRSVANVSSSKVKNTKNCNINYGLVKFADAAGARKAITDLHGTTLKERIIGVREFRHFREMGDEEPQCKVEYLDVKEGESEETNWIKRAGRCRVTYPNGHIFEGTYDAERVKQGYGKYMWMGPASEEDETLVEKAKYEGNYKDGFRHGQGEMKYPNGDVYVGDWFENKMQGEGTYTYKKTGDIYSGSWLNDKKHGEGTYEFGVDKSVMVGQWSEGQITTGNWELKGAAVYSGEFKLGRPYGPGNFFFEGGLHQKGSYEVKKPAEGEEEEAPAEGEAPRPPNVTWKGQNIVFF